MRGTHRILIYETFLKVHMLANSIHIPPGSPHTLPCQSRWHNWKLLPAQATNMAERLPVEAVEYMM